MSSKDAEDIAQIWISTELNPVEGENMWQSQSPLVETQQGDQPELQITLQEVINMIDITAQEKTMATDGSHEETLATDGSHEETLATDGSHEETLATDDNHEEILTTNGNHEKTMAEEDLQ